MAAGVKMPILKYFSRKDTLSNPNGSLSHKVPPRAIIAANREVSELVNSVGRQNRKQKYSKNNVKSCM